jgi:triosephosphate isomerase
MRRPIVAGNWKMNLTGSEALQLVESIARQLHADDSTSDHSVEVVVCPPFVYLQSIAAATQGTALGLGAQDVYFERAGAFTGEISAPMLVDVGCRYTIIGHSERRTLCGESDRDVSRKLSAALQAGLTPIICVGELLDERATGQTTAVIERQFAGACAELDAAQMAGCVIAYEPVWAIGTGQVATPEQAEEVHRHLRRMVSDRFGDQVAQGVRIQYGGSVNAENALSLLRQPNIDGALVGGASLKADGFLAIVRAAAQSFRTGSADR